MRKLQNSVMMKKELKKAKKAEEKPVRDKSGEHSTSLSGRLKEEIMKFIDIEPLNNGTTSHISDINRLKVTAELSVKIGVARTLLLNLELTKLNSYLSVIKNNLEFHFPEMEDSKNTINSIFEKIDDINFEVEELDKITALLKINIEEQ